MRFKHSYARGALAAGSAGFVVLAAGVSVAASGNPAFVPLTRVQRAYRHTPGIELTAAAGSSSASAQSRRFLLWLRNGIVTAEEFIDPGRHGVLVVARRGSSTFMRAAEQSCWRRLRDSNPAWVLKNPVDLLARLHRSDPRTLLNVGWPFPEHGKVLTRRNKTGALQLVIETHSAFWFLAGSVVPKKIARKSFLTITPNPATHIIRSIQVGAPEPVVRATLRVKPLKARPSIPRPTPTC
jgi:hypothetical protein